jgi:hypothetical protein
LKIANAPPAALTKISLISFLSISGHHPDAHETGLRKNARHHPAECGRVTGIGRNVR